MGSPSGDGWDNITQPERGPQGPGDVAKATVSYSDAGVPVAEAASKAGANHVDNDVRGRLHAELSGAWCLKPY